MKKVLLSKHSKRKLAVIVLFWVCFVGQISTFAVKRNIEMMQSRCDSCPKETEKDSTLFLTDKLSQNE
jgi:hypothetical protein